MDEEQGGFHQPRKTRWPLVAAVATGHVLVLVGLTYAFAPDFSRMVVEEATSLVTVTVRTIETPPPPEPDNKAEEGASAEEGREEVPRPVTAPEQPRPRENPAPRASSTGRANTGGASNEGSGTGGGGDGNGTGSGNSGSGQGGGFTPTRPSVRSGQINAARDFPIPDGGRQVRHGTSITVQFTVNVDGTASNCSVTSPGPDPTTNALVCPLVMERIRFNPATDSNGQPVAARYGWRQDFTRRD